MRILALDGGGLRGLVTTSMLERLWPIMPPPELYAGTSTGGILALGLAAGLSPQDLTKLYVDGARKIFRDGAVFGLTGAKYKTDGLREVLDEHFGDATLGELSAKVVIPCFNLAKALPGKPDHWAPHFLTNLDLPCNDRELLVVDAALRTSAAPTYFPTTGSYVDGGLVANDPALVALALACAAGAKIEDCRILSLGTGAAYQKIVGGPHDWGKLEWVAKLIPLLLDANVSNAELLLPGLLGQDYCRINPPLRRPVALDDTSALDELRQTGLGAITETDAARAWLAARWATSA